MAYSFCLRRDVKQVMQTRGVSSISVRFTGRHMDFHIINTNDKLTEDGYKMWLSHDYAFTNGVKQRYGETLRHLSPGDLVFMYVSGKGIKTVGMVIKK